ncbi:MAG: S8 family serine peptidase, partial [Bacteroidota bacterium]
MKQSELFFFGYQGIVYAAQQGAQVINCSWGGGSNSRFGQDVVQFATLNQGAAVFAACGNSGSDFAFYPAAYEEVISVANTSFGDTTFANTTYHFTVDLAAPGWQIYSTLGNSGYHRWGGTSASAPIVAGGVALVKSHFPQYSGVQAAQRLRITADDIYAQNLDKIDKLGQGRINLLRALNDPAKPAIRQLSLGISDQDGDGFFRSGDILELRPTFRNYLEAGTFLEIELSLPQEMTGFAEVLDGSRTIGAIGANQIFNPSQPFRLRLKAGLPPDVQIYLRFQYQDTPTQYQDVEMVGFQANTTYLDVEVNQVRTTVNSQGNFGWNDFFAQSQGLGFRYQNRANVLFEGSLLIAANGKVADRARDTNGVDLDFRLLESIERMETHDPVDFASVSTLDDQAMDDPIGIQVTQETYAYARSEWENFVILRYILTNTSTS